MVKNCAFVFIKPHAVTDQVKELCKQTFEKHSITITKEGSMEAAEIDKAQKIDKHYYSIASKATLLKPDALAIPKDQFKEKFGVEWDAVLKDGKALNALDACKALDVDAQELDKMWAACKKAGNLVKFGGGFYCGKLEKDGKGPFYVFNGFFMAMREKFVAEGASIYYYVVEWEDRKWSEFRGDVLGSTDPTTAPKDSLRGAILADWKKLGLKAEPDVGDNGVHSSASPFEALAERVNWLGIRIERDPFGKVLLKHGLPAGLIRDWCKDPQVTFGPIPMTRSLFDTLEDTDTAWCAALCSMIGKPKKDPREKEVEDLRKQVEKYEVLANAVATIQAHRPIALPPKAAKGSGKGSGKGKEGERQEKRSEGGEGGGKGKGKGGKSKN